MSQPVKKLRLAVLVSGGGTTLRNLLDRIKAGTLAAEIAVVISSNPRSPGLAMAEAAGIATKIITTKEFPSVSDFSESIFAACDAAKTDYVICAGFLKRLAIPARYAERVVNIHPSLIPSFCGTGMYGHHVHEAVLAAGAKLSGCTVHFVDDHYDHGPIIAQRAVPVLLGDTPASLAARVFAQECELYPTVINWLAAGLVKIEQGRAVVGSTS
jgi:formyltetrahydrofolate-dependent phosphoribosylglycinamide formyltransferase